MQFFDGAGAEDIHMTVDMEADRSLVQPFPEQVVGEVCMADVVALKESNAESRNIDRSRQHTESPTGLGAPLGIEVLHPTKEVSQVLKIHRKRLSGVAKRRKY